MTLAAVAKGQDLFRFIPGGSCVALKPTKMVPWSVTVP